MPITATDLITPTGALTVELLVAVRADVGDAEAAAGLYAAAGVAKTAAWADAGRQDRGAIAWATYRALMDRAQQITSAAASVSATDVARAYQVGQAVELKKDAAAWLADYEAVAAEEAAAGTTPEPTPLPPISRSVPFTVAW